MHSQNIRLSRVSHPRGTLLAAILLAVVFLSFGLVAEACLPTMDDSGRDCAATSSQTYTMAATSGEARQ